MATGAVRDPHQRQHHRHLDQHPHHGGVPALEIARRVGAKPSTLSGHLAILRRAGPLIATRHQREIRYAANLAAVNDLILFLLADCYGGDVAACADVLPLVGTCKG